MQVTYRETINIDLDSYWSKTESIPIGSINNLSEQLNNIQSNINNKVSLDGTNIIEPFRQNLRDALGIEGNVDLSNYWTKNELIPINKINDLQSTLSVINNKIDNKVNLTGSNISGIYKQNLRDVLGITELEGNSIGEEDLNSKLDKPTSNISSPNATFKYVVILNEQGVTRKMLVGALSKNVANSKPTSVGGAGLNLGAMWEIDTQGYPMKIQSLADKSNDTTFNRMLAQNEDGTLAISNGSEMLISAMSSTTDEQKDRFRVASRKVGENYSLGQPRVDVVNPMIINNSLDYIQYVAVVGLNLFLNVNNPSATSVKLIRVKTEEGQDTNDVYPIDNINVFENNYQMFSFGVNFSTYPNGIYKISVTHNNLTNITSPEIRISNNIEQLNTNLSELESVDKFENPNDVLNQDMVYHKNEQEAGRGILEKATKVKNLITFNEGFYFELLINWNPISSYNESSFDISIDNQDVNITQGYSSNFKFGVKPADYGRRLVVGNSQSNEYFARNSNNVIKAIVINKNGITTISATFGNTTLTESYPQLFNNGDKIHMYINNISTNTGYGISSGSEMKVFLPKKYVKL